MAEKRKNQPPTGQGKKQSPVKGQSGKIAKRSMVAQASNARQNLGTSEDEMSQRENPSRKKNNPDRPKAGR
jgi:hypothetical protein